MNDITLSVDGTGADGFSADQPSVGPGREVTFELFFFDEGPGAGDHLDRYRTLREFVEWSNPNRTETWLSSVGGPGYQERVPSAASFDTFVVGIEAGADVHDPPDVWALVVGAEDASVIAGDRDMRVLLLDVFVLADLADFATVSDVQDEFERSVLP